MERISHDLNEKKDKDKRQWSMPTSMSGGNVVSLNLYVVRYSVIILQG